MSPRRRPRSAAAVPSPLLAPTWAPLDTLAALSGPRVPPVHGDEAGGLQAGLAGLAGADELLLLQRLEEAFIARPASAAASPSKRRPRPPRSPPNRRPLARPASAPGLSPLARPKSAAPPSPAAAAGRPSGGGGAAGATWPARQPPGAALGATCPGRVGTAPLTQAAADGVNLHETTLWAYSSPCFTSKKWAPSKRLLSPRCQPGPGQPEDAAPQPEQAALSPISPAGVGHMLEFAKRAAPSPLRSRRARAGHWEEYALGSLKRGKALSRRSSLRLLPSAARFGRGAAPPRAAQAKGKAATWPEAQPGGGGSAPSAGRTPTSSPTSGGGGLERTLFPVQAHVPHLPRRYSTTPDGLKSPQAPGSPDAPAPRRFTVGLEPSREGPLTPRSRAGSVSSAKGRGSLQGSRASSVSPTRTSRSPQRQPRGPGRGAPSSPEKSSHLPPEVLVEENLSSKAKRMLGTYKINSVFHRFKKDGEVHKEALASALTFIGFHPVKEWIDEVAEKVSTYTTVDRLEFHSIVEQYQERRLIEQRLAFQSADKDGSGTIDMQEMSDILMQLGMEPMDFVVEGLFDEVDEDKNGTIDADEFDEFWMIIESREGFSRVEYNRLMGAFDIFDWDNSGTLDMDETAKVLHYLHYTLSAEEAEGIFRSVDVSNLGHLTKREFLLFMRKIREHEVAKMSECLAKVFDTTKEGTFTKLLMVLGHVPDRDAVIQCAEDAGIDLTDKPAAKSIRMSRIAELSAPSSRRGSDRRSQRHGSGSSTSSAPAANTSLDMSRKATGNLSTSRNNMRSRSSVGSAIALMTTVASEPQSRKRNSTGSSNMMKTAQTEPSPGTLPAMEVSPGEAWKFLEIFRAREGLTREELHKNQEAFARVLGVEVEVIKDDDDSTEITYHQTWIALRWLGWVVPKEVQQQLIGSVDLDNSGCLNLKEFHKLMRHVREREDEELQKVRQVMELPHAGLFEVVHMVVAKRMLSEMGFHESVDIKSILRKLGIKPEHGASGVASRSIRFSVKAEERLDWFNLVRVVRYLRSEQRADRRKFYGFTRVEVDKLTAVFTQCAYKKVIVKDDGEKEVESSFLRVDVFLSLLEEDYAPAMFHGVDLRDVRDRVLAACPAGERVQVPRERGVPTGAGPEKERSPGAGDEKPDRAAMDAKEFLKMMNDVYADADARYHRRLQCAEESCNFSAQEVREFRTIFLEWDTREAGLLPFDQVVEIVNGLTPLKAVHIAELYAVWEVVVSKLDAAVSEPADNESDISSADNKRLSRKMAHHSRLAAHEPGSTDFPEFLCFMERLLATDFHNIKSNTATQAAKVEKEDRRVQSKAARSTVFGQ